MIYVIWLGRRLFLPTILATVVGRTTFALVQTGINSFSDIFSDWQDAAYTFLMVLITLTVVTLVAVLMHKANLHPVLRLVLLPVIGAAALYALVFYLTEVEAYAALGIAPAIAATVVWILCNLDLIKQKQKDIAHG